MEASHKQHQLHIQVRKDAEEEVYTLKYKPCVAVSTDCVVSLAVSAGTAVDEMSTDPLVSKTSVLPAITGKCVLYS